MFGGIFKKLKKVVGGAVKIAAATSPIWSNFVPGGSIAGKILTKVSPLINKARQVRTKLRSAGFSSQMLPERLLKFGTRARNISSTLGGPRLAMMAGKSFGEQANYAAQGVHHAGIRGPVAQRYGPIHNHLRAASMERTTARRRRPMRGYTRRRTMTRRGRGGRYRRYGRKRAA